MQKGIESVRKVEEVGWFFGLCLASLMVSVAPECLLGQKPDSAPPPAQEASQPSTPRRQLSPEERADIFMARKEYADAVDFYLRALKQEGRGQAPLSAPLWNKLGIAYQQQTDYGAARKCYKKAIHYQKDFPEPWNNLGTTYFLANNAKKSIKYYQEAVKLGPTNASFHLNLGTAYHGVKKFDQAVEEYRSALTLDPNVLIAHSARGTILEARSVDASFFFYLAKVFASLGRSEEAVRYLRRAFEEGFHDRKRLEEDPDFQKLSADPAYLELLKNPPVPIKD